MSVGYGRKLIAGAVLLVLLLRALVPQGFMPASGRPLSLELCPEGLPAQLLRHADHHHHGVGHWHSEHCVFGGSCAGGPVAHIPLLNTVFLAELAPGTPFLPAAIVVQLVYLPHGRGPPARV
jgi:hypothetical protein